mgnify:CR=1 FL=1
MFIDMVDFVPFIKDYDRQIQIFYWHFHELWQYFLNMMIIVTTTIIQCNIDDLT